METKFKSGDEFIPKKPRERSSVRLRWLDTMDEFDGKTLTVESISSEGNIRPKEVLRYLFHPDWCIKVEKPLREMGYVKIEKATGEINMSEPMKAGLETITDAHIASTYQVSEGSVNTVVDNPYKVVEGNIPDDEASDYYDKQVWETAKWEARRYELAKAAMQGIIVNVRDFGCISEVVRDSISFADEMIKQLKGE